MKNTALKLKIHIILAYTLHVGLYFIASINWSNFFSFLLGVRALFGARVFERLKKLKLSHYTTRRRLGERRYSSYSLSTSALDGCEWSASRPDRDLAPGKAPPVPIVQEAGWAPEPVWTQRLKEIFLILLGIDLRSPGRPVRSQTLYWLRYPAHIWENTVCYLQNSFC
jgi:hypothetical protein